MNRYCPLRRLLPSFDVNIYLHELVLAFLSALLKIHISLFLVLLNQKFKELTSHINKELTVRNFIEAFIWVYVLYSEKKRISYLNCNFLHSNKFNFAKNLKVTMVHCIFHWQLQIFWNRFGFIYNSLLHFSISIYY